MFDPDLVLTPIHYLYLIGVISILTVMILRKDTLLVCIGFLFFTGVIGLGSVTGGIMTVFNAILYASKEFMEIIATIALIISLSRCLKDLGSDYLLMTPMAKIMKSPSLTWWILGFTMLVFSLFLWPSPAVALVGAIIFPFALKAGLDPLMAAIAMNLFGHGIALSSDFIIQGAPAISAGAASIETSDILTEGMPLFLVMGIVSVLSAYLLNRKNITACCANVSIQEKPDKEPVPFFSLTMAILTPLFFLIDVVLLLVFDFKGGEATSLISGTAILLTCIGAVMGFGIHSLERITFYITDGFLFAIRIFAPVIIIGAFFFLGGNGISTIMGESFQRGIMNDWAIWLAHNIPINKYMAAVLQMAIGCLTGLDGSGFSGLPLTGAFANTFGTAVGASVPVLASLGQITGIFVGGGTIVPWGLVPVAAICNVNPLELARKNLLPVSLGFLATFVVACFLL
ncbi:citrate transporter [Clostridium sp. HBUAS56010]|uniref:citrate transporter n=1 Tax=Clostridium sp. HBUAS56010 TaxID=2571127 RepID=UPI0011783807|nr:citrate transporter [Clostridium sp. HBUAS56010]